MATKEIFLTVLLLPLATRAFLAGGPVKGVGPVPVVVRRGAADEEAFFQKSFPEEGKIAGSAAAPLSETPEEEGSEAPPPNPRLPVAGIAPANAELDGARKAFALFNAGVITREEIDGYAKDFAKKRREKEKARRDAEEALKKKDLDKEVQVAAVTQLTFDVAGGLWRSAASGASKAARFAANKAAEKAAEAAEKAVKGVGDAVKGAALGAVDGVVDVTVRAPARAATKAVVDVATAPKRAVEGAVAKVANAPAKAVDRAKEQTFLATSEAQRAARSATEAAAERLLRAKDAAVQAPFVARDAARDVVVVATAVVAGGARLAAKNVTEAAKTRAAEIQATLQSLTPPPMPLILIEQETDTLIVDDDQPAFFGGPTTSRVKAVKSIKTTSVDEDKVVLLQEEKEKDDDDDGAKVKVKVPDEEVSASLPLRSPLEEEKRKRQALVAVLPTTVEVAAVIGGAAARATESVADAAARLASEAKESALESVRRAARDAADERARRARLDADADAKRAALVARFDEAQKDVLSDVVVGASRQNVSTTTVLEVVVSPDLEEALNDRKARALSERADRLPPPTPPPQTKAPRVVEPRFVEPLLVTPEPKPQADEARAAQLAAETRFQVELNATREDRALKRNRRLDQLRDSIIQQSV